MKSVALQLFCCEEILDEKTIREEVWLKNEVDKKHTIDIPLDSWYNDANSPELYYLRRYRMSKTIIVRGKKEIVAVYDRYIKLTGKQNQGRPQATADFVRYVAGLPNDENTARELKLASKQLVDVSLVEDKDIPSSIKVIVDVTDEEWDTAMNVFRKVFDLKANPQMPYFIRVSGTACIKKLEKENAKLERNVANENILDIESFKSLSIDEKLVKIYELLLERRG